MSDSPEGFGDLMFRYLSEKSEFEDKLEDFGVIFDHIGGDAYDMSLELYKVGKDIRLSAECQEYIFRSGFVKVYVNHDDGWETIYTSLDGKAVRGWRRLRRDGGFDISFWPDGWGKRDWLETGYMRIVPDPLEVAPQ